MLGRVSDLRIFCPLIGLLLADCATAVAQPSLGAPPPANYRQIASDGDAATILRDRDKPGKPQTGSEGRPIGADVAGPKVRPKGPTILMVSSLRKTIATEQGDWFACLEAVRDGIASYYGLSFVGPEIVEWRPAVAIDHCEQQAYMPLPPPSKKPKTADDKAHTPARKPRR